MHWAELYCVACICVNLWTGLLWIFCGNVSWKMSLGLTGAKLPSLSLRVQISPCTLASYKQDFTQLSPSYFLYSYLEDIFSYQRLRCHRLNNGWALITITSSFKVRWMLHQWPVCSLQCITFYTAGLTAYIWTHYDGLTLKTRAQYIFCLRYSLTSGFSLVTHKHLITASAHSINATLKQLSRTFSSNNTFLYLFLLIALHHTSIFNL